MVNNKKITVVLPAYNAGKTLRQTYAEIPFDIVDEIVLVDDGSSDDTTAVGRDLGIKHLIEHSDNLGYGGNQKTCYKRALELKSDIIVMLHPDYQYTPRLLHSMVYLIANDVYDVVLGSRILGKGALKGGMPFYKYLANRTLTLVQNILMNQKLSEYHTGYRAYAARVLQSINYMENSDNFLFDNQVLAQVLFAGFNVGEVSCPTRYSETSSSIKFGQSIVYGLGVIQTSFCYFFQKLGLARFRMFRPPAR